LNSVNDVKHLVIIQFVLLTQHIITAFEGLERQAADIGGPLQQLTTYMRRTWIDGSIWRVDNWCLFRETIRTNNDVEGNLTFIHFFQI
jgi:hypothetical protein